MKGEESGKVTKRRMKEGGREGKRDEGSEKGEGRDTEVARRTAGAASHCPDDRPYMSTDTGRCTAECGPGKYGDDSSRTCEACGENCKTCLGHPEHCTSCEDPLYLSENRCETDCGSLLSRGPARGRIRLSGGRNSFEGVVEILHDGVYGTICDDGWNINAAHVVCAELELGQALEAVNALEAGFEPVSVRTPILLDNVRCSGDESNIRSCTHSQWYTNMCGHFEDAGVRCSGPDVTRMCVKSCGDGYYQVPGTNQCELCDPECNTCAERADNCLSCDAPRYLLNDRCVEDCGIGFYGYSRTRTCEPCSPYCKNCGDGDRDDACTSCPDNTFLSNGRCISSCPAPLLSKKLAIRIVDGTTPYEGRVEVFVNGDWGTVCDDNFDFHAATVICRQLGYGPAVMAVRSPGFGPGTGKILIDDLKCNGTESELVNCAQSPFGENDCNHHEDAGVQCSGTSAIGATGACLASCERGYFAQESTCALCSASCLECAGSPDHCMACKPNTFLQGSTCVESCSGSDFGNTLTWQCEACDLHACGSCANGNRNNICLTCPQGKFMRNSTCVTSCQPDMFLRDDTCVSDCGTAMYGHPGMNTCQRCDTSCLNCTFDPNGVKCTSCSPPKILDPATGVCVERCSTGVAAMVEAGSSDLQQTSRLVGGRNHLEGRLEIFHDNQWGTVCADHFDKEAAQVACRALGLGNATGVLRVDAQPGVIVPGEGPIWLDNILCMGFEANLESCHFTGWGEHNCEHSQDIGIRCSGPGMRECRETCPLGFYANLTDSSCYPCRTNCDACQATPDYVCTACRPGTHRKGGDQCVTGCGDGFYASGGECVPCSSNCATCERDSTHCTSCESFKFLQDNTCVSECRGYRMKNNAIRLVGGASPLEGQLEIRRGDTYGSVCDDHWDLPDADVVCRQLGFGHALEASLEGKFAVRRDSIMLLSNVMCTGDESNLLECKHSEPSGFDCHFWEAAGVICSGPDTSNMCIEASQCTNGRYVDEDGISCGVCDQNCATCSQTATHCLTCRPGLVRRSDFTCGETCEDGTYADDQGMCQRCSEQCLACSGSAVHCTRCHQSLYLDTDTNTCVSSCVDGLAVRGSPDIRLVDGQTPYEGRVEIRVNNVWGTVCDDEFDLADAHVVCQQLNFGHAIEFRTNAHYGSGTSIHLDDLACVGDESRLLDCPRNSAGIGVHDCGNHEDVGVVCSGQDTSLKCVSTCDDGYFAGLNAQNASECMMCSDNCLTCRGSGDNCTKCTAPYFLNAGTCTTQCPPGQYGNIDSRECRPCDSACGECFNGRVNNVCKSCKASFFLQDSTCVSSCSDGYQPLSSLLQALGEIKAIRLMGGANEREGILQISHNDQWGTVCNNNWDMADAHVVCHQLGQGRAVGVLNNREFTAVSTDTPILLSGVDCKGWELGLSQCRNSDWGPSMGCGHSQDVAIRCSGENDQQRDSICRRVTPSHCDTVPCSSGVDCVSLDGNQSVCLECPPGEVGNGTACTVVANTLPSFQEVPRNRTLRIGLPAMFRCKAQGVPTPRVTASSWLKDGQPLTQEDLDSRRVRIYSSSGTLQLVRTRREDTGNYTCVISNTQGSNSSSAFLVVEEPPHILAVQSEERVLGETAVLQCSVTGMPASTVTWQRGGRPLLGDRFQNCGGNGTLLISGVTHNDAGSYKCSAVNELGEDFSVVSLTVHEPPTFQLYPKELHVREGSSAELGCAASGVPQPALTWKKDGEQISYHTGRVVARSDGTLLIINVQQEDMGEYACIATNEVQTSFRAAKLLVFGPPQITESPSNQTMVTGETLRLPCKVIGTNNPVVTWTHNQDPVSEDKRHTLSDGMLTVTNVDPTDAGLYICTATNSEGSVNDSAYVSVTGPVVHGRNKRVGMAALVVPIFIVFIILAIILAVWIKRRRSQGSKEVMANAIFKGNSSSHTIRFTHGSPYRKFDDTDFEKSEEMESEHGAEKGKGWGKLRVSPKKGMLLEEEEDDKL
ncbi:antigen WC1.1-like [Diadema antillarum]|uniref:antigen WC1.1-like n=1 Tax=Diadema antillarum TaxID=105358 RepID=UPI003A8600FB